MPCVTCEHWNRIDGHAGRCGRDQAPAHSNYHCIYYRSKASDNHLGLTFVEIDWLQAHPTWPAAKELIGLYRMVVDAPNDPGARGIFAAALGHWRTRNKSTPR
jgi:hypothetical protein